MEEVEDLYKRIKFEAIKTLAFNIFLNASIIFLALNFILSFFGIPYIISLIPALAYFVKSLTSHIRKFDLKEFESKNPDLKHIVDIAHDTVGNKHALSETMFDNLVRRTKTAVLFNLISNKRVREKIYIIVFLSLIAILIGSLNLYPTKVFFRVSDIDLTQPYFWSNIYQRIDIQKPEFASCYSELNYTQRLLGESSLEMRILRDRSESLQRELNKTKDELVQKSEETMHCSAELEETKPFKTLYEQEKESLDAAKTQLASCKSDVSSLTAEKASCLSEKGVYIFENSDLRTRVDDLRDDLIACQTA